MVALVAAFLVAIPARIIGFRKQIMDTPGHRSSHTVAVPRTGGIAILIAMAVSVLVTGEYTNHFLYGIASVVIISVVSFLDDLYTIPSIPRLAVHLLVTAAAVKLLGVELADIELPFMTLHLGEIGGLIFAVLFVAGFVNFFNFMDGINGISAAQGFFGGGMLAVLFIWGGSANSVIVSMGLCGACVGFLPHNFPKAKMFMGDSGSTSLGYILAMLTLIGAGRTDIPWVAFMLPLGVFLYDATFTLFKRVIKRENFVKAHREHHYQLLIRCGWSHARVTGVQAALMLVGCVGAGIYAKVDSDGVRLGLLCVLLAIMVCYSVLVHGYFATHRMDLPEAIVTGGGEDANEDVSSDTENKTENE